MAGRQSIKVEGLRELDRALNDLRKEHNLSNTAVKNVYKKGMTKALTPMLSDAKAKAPVEWGQLRDSIKITTTLSRSAKKGYQKESQYEMFLGASALPHAHLQEFGTSEHSAQPFLRPAWDSHLEQILKTMSRYIGDEIQKAAERAEKRAAKRILKAKLGK